jgi:hypothetical protein
MSSQVFPRSWRFVETALKRLHGNAKKVRGAMAHAAGGHTAIALVS